MRARCGLLTHDSMLSLQDAVHVYRYITGACAHGIKKFVEEKLEDRVYSISELLDITRGQKGHKYFKAYFEPNSPKVINEPKLYV